jgi:adenine phosphoribosyltransferase
MTPAAPLDLRSCIRSIPDFPKPGIMFRDITPLLRDPAAFAESIRVMAAPYKKGTVDVVVGAESRGFIFAAGIALALGAGFVPIRKKGKLPAKTTSVSYALEYGTDTLEMHDDAVGPGDRVLIIDDVLATGGTAGAKAALVAGAGAEVAGFAFLMELDFLHGREKLGDLPITSLMHVG